MFNPFSPLFTKLMVGLGLITIWVFILWECAWYLLRRRDHMKMRHAAAVTGACSVALLCTFLAVSYFL